MKRSILIAYMVVFCIGINGTAFSVQHSDFPLMAPLKGQWTADTPVRLALPHEVISKTSPGFADLRIFNDLEKETPYVIYLQRRPKQEPRSFLWKIRHYKNTEDTQTVILERPEKTAPARDLTLVTRTRDFNKTIDVYGGEDLSSWGFIATGTVFDFSSQIDLTRTSLSLPATKARYLKVILKDRIPTTQDKENMRLRYKDLEFSLDGQKRGVIEIQDFSSRTSMKSPEKIRYDHVIQSNPKTSIDKEGNSIDSMGYLNLPLEKVSLKIKNRYYCRPIELRVSKTDEDKSYNLVARGTICRLPDISEEKNSLSSGSKRCAYVRLKIVNHDNPPLQVEEVKIQWARRNLFFVPEKGRSYALFFNGKDVSPPQYEMRRIIPNKYEKLMSYIECRSGTIKKNEKHSPGHGPGLWAGLDRFLFSGLVILLVCILGFWIYRLTRNFPDNRAG